MVKYYAKKILQYFIVLLVAITLNFLLPRIMPGDPVKYMVGEDYVYMTVEERDALREEHGLNDPVLVQYGRYLGNLLRGDLGYSYQSGREVSEMIGEKIPWTLLLSGINIVLTTVAGVVLGTIAAWKHGSKLDLFLNNLMAFFKSMPSFWIGMILIAVFGVSLGWFPVYGAQSAYARLTGLDKVLDIAHHLVLPEITLLVISVTSIFVTMRFSMIGVLGEDYIVMARMKGLTERAIKYKHGMRNALIPVVTIVMMNMGYILGGATVIETVFAYPGMGRLLYDSVIGRDYPLIQGCFLISTLCVVAANIIADFLYPLIDPKAV